MVSSKLQVLRSHRDESDVEGSNGHLEQYQYSAREEIRLLTMFGCSNRWLERIGQTKEEIKRRLSPSSAPIARLRLMGVCLITSMS